MTPTAHRAVGPILAGIALFAAVFYLLAAASLTATGGTLVYPIDDTYIEMAMARTLATSGTFGFWPGEPAFAASSPLWVFLLTPAVKAGLLDAAPAILNAGAAILLLVTSARHLARLGVTRAALFAAVVALNAAVPLAAIAAVGLEHVLHAWLTLAFAIAVAASYTETGARARHTWLRPAAWAFLLAACRYEGLFAIGIAVVLLVTRARRRAAVAIAIAGILPAVIHGGVALAAGWDALPTSLLLKGHFPTAGLVKRMFVTLYASPTVHLLAILNAVALVLPLRRHPMTPPLTIMFLGTVALHMMFASIDAMVGRYDAYLIAFGIVCLVPWVEEVVKLATPLVSWRGAGAARVALIAVAATALLWPVADRGWEVSRIIPVGSLEMFRQQYQMARLTRAIAPGEAVVINDLGLVTYLGAIHPVDLYGLGTIEVTRLRRAGLMTPERLDAIARAHGAGVALAYPQWITRYGGGEQPSWIPIADLTMPSAIVAGGSLVRLYAIDPARAPALREAAARFAAGLPPGATLTLHDTGSR